MHIHICRGRNGLNMKWRSLSLKSKAAMSRVIPYYKESSQSKEWIVFGGVHGLVEKTNNNKTLRSTIIKVYVRYDGTEERLTGGLYGKVAIHT